MKLNLHILQDELEAQITHATGMHLVASQDISLNLAGCRFASKNNHDWSEEFLYLVEAETLRRVSSKKNGLHFLCLGPLEDSFFQERDWEALILPTNKKTAALFPLVQEIFEKYSNWHDELSSAVLRKEQLQAVMDTGCRVLANPLAFFDNTYGLSAYAGPKLPEDITGSIWDAVLTRKYSPLETVPVEDRTIFYRNLAERQQPFLAKSPPVFCDKNFLVAPVARDGDVFGMVAASDILAPFTPGQITLVNHLKDMLALYFQISIDVGGLLKNTDYFAARILQGFSIEPGAVTFHLDRRGWKLRGDYRLFFFVSKSGESPEAIQRDFNLQRLKQYLPSGIVFAYENGIVAILREPFLQLDQTWHSGLIAFLEEMKLQAGVSMVIPSFLDLKLAFIQSKTALLVGQKKQPDGILYRFLVSYRDHVIHILSEATSLKSLCHPRLLDYALQGGASKREAILSLRIYLYHGGNSSLAAKALHIHRNTLMHRLRRFEDLLEIDLDNLSEDQFLNLYLSCLILDHLTSD